MAKILCAIRGGEESQRLQDIAIQRAKERGEQIVFLYVVNTEFLDTASASLRESVTLEMEKLGDFLLLMAQERAKKEGVVAEPLLQHGYLQPEIKAAASQHEITIFGNEARHELSVVGFSAAVAGEGSDAFRPD